MEIRYLINQEKLKIRPLYERIFDDSEEFVNYYFSGPIYDNDVLVLEIDGEIASMLQLVKKKIMYNERMHFVHYIYAVATDEKYRNKGYMGMLLRRAIEDLRQKGDLFTYLIPVDEKIYERYGFKTVYSKQKYKTIKLLEEEKIYNPGKLEIEIMKKLSSNILPAKYDTYIVHDDEYFERIIKEMQIENGYLVFHMQGEEIVGYSITGADNEIVETVFDIKPMKIALKRTVPWVMIKELTSDCNVRRLYINDET